MINTSKRIFFLHLAEKYDNCYWQIQDFIRRGEENSVVELEIHGKPVKIKRIKTELEWAYTSSLKPSYELIDLYKSESNSHIIQKIQDDIAIITINSFILKNMRGFIIDVRKNGGGSGGIRKRYCKSIYRW